MHPENAFVTLTYAPEKLVSPKLNYEDFQLFMKKLRNHTNNQLSYFVTGEYGELTKRPHWHAILFNWSPSDARHVRTTELGHRVYHSDLLDKLWGHGFTEFGNVTIQSAGYCARYAAKKLVHGNDDEHDFKPISKKSNKSAIGKKWIEKYYEDVFTHGYIILPDGSKSTIPRYYEKWFKQNHPEKWERYVTQEKQKKIESAQARSDREKLEYERNLTDRGYRLPPKTANQKREAVQKSKFKILQNNLKLK